MTTEQINVAIAESMGWLDISRCGKSSMKPSITGLQFRGTKDELTLSERDYYFLPNYCADLNACADFERTLTPDESADYYYTHLPNVTGSDTDDWMHKQLPKLASATAPQRCEAYLKVKGLWVEGGAK